MLKMLGSADYAQELPRNTETRTCITGRAGTGRVRQFLGSRDLGLTRSAVVLLAMLGLAGRTSPPWPFLRYSFFLHTSPPYPSSLSNATSLFSLAISVSLHALAPEVLASHSNPKLMHISSFGSSIAASSPKIGVYKGTCRGSFCLSVCASTCNLYAWIV